MFAPIRASITVSKRSMGSVVMKGFGAPTSVLKFNNDKSSLHTPSEGEVVVQVVSSQVVHEDNRFIRGLSFANSNAHSSVAGVNAVGKVASVGSGVSGLKVGDSVFVLNSGSWSDSITVKASRASKILDVGDQFALMPSYLTAWAILNDSISAGLKAGDSVIHTEGSSAVGSAISQVGNALGFKVTGVSEADLNSSDSKNVKLAISSLSGKPLRELLKHISNGGRIVTFNGALTPVLSTSGVDIPTGASIFDNKSVSGFDLGAWVANNEGGFRDGCAAISSLLSDKKIGINDVKVLSLADYQKALDAVQSLGSAVVLKA